MNDENERKSSDGRMRRVDEVVNHPINTLGERMTVKKRKSRKAIGPINMSVE